MKKTFFGKRLSAGILAMLILLGALPVIALPGFAANETDPTLGEYVALPITIRDYAADGMLFEWNELGDNTDLKKTKTVEGWSDTKTVTVNQINPSSVAENQIHVVIAGHTVSAYYTFWLGFICDKDGTIREIISNGTKKMEKINGMSGGQYAVLLNGNKVSLLSGITTNNKNQYRLILNADEKTITVKKWGTTTITETYHQSNTLGYSLLNTNDKDIFNDLPEKDGAIKDTDFEKNGEWGDKTVTSSQVTLNSGALQTLYGCLVRTNLVESKLGANGKPVYTQATVEYLAKYMQKTLQEVWQKSENEYNLWYVMGTKLYNDKNEYVGINGNPTRDLADVFRSCIAKDNLGSYAATVANVPTKPTECKTYTDAAYFLLSNLYTDNDGYGVTATEYHQINLVKKGDAYVFNSAYDGSVYDTEAGVIYNSQTDKITARKVTKDGVTTDQYVRGNILPENRFDPINGRYYGNNSNEYLKVKDPDGKDSKNYYAQTNYNLTLEGHAQFIFYEDDNMYFNFTGDDDVYLYINGTRVMDMGGAHSISKCGINLNDVKELCGLRDGEVYDFDFFYMERHGTAANFGIETNIRIVDPSMLTEKSAYQNGTEVGNGGLVDAKAPVKYQYELKNNGEAKIVDLEFDDPQIGVKLTKDKITLNDETDITKLYAAVYDNDGKAKVEYQIGTLTEADLKDLLAAGLEVGEKIQIFGFEYTIPDDKWSSDDKFTNTVYTKAKAPYNTTHRTLTGIDTSTVKKADITYGSLHYYEWAGHGVTATRDELVKQVEKALTAAGIDHTFTEKDTITLCSASGNADTDTYKYNPNAKVETDGVKYVAEKPEGEDKYKTGASTYYYKIGTYGPVTVTVYSYDVADDKFVIDYNLPVTFDGDKTFLTNDTVSIGANPYKTTATPSVTESTAAYGTVTVSGMSITYTMNKFMNGVEDITLTVTVLEDGAEDLTTKTGVVMTETISIAPANVMYYEDDFEDIKYIDSDGGNTWEYFESDRGTAQSPDQDTPYGSDPNYAGDKETEGYESKILNAIKNWVSSISVFDFGTLLEDDTAPTAENAGSGNAAGQTPIGDSSNGTIHRLCVRQTADVMSFEFRGTGFEILSRTTQDIYAVVSVKVVSKTTQEVVKQFPVITECKGGDLYQVPILAVKGLPLDTYTVTLAAAGGTETKARTLYIDGVRIYQPLDAVDQTKYYNAAEANAEFYEIKNLIGDGMAVYYNAQLDDDGNGQLVTGNTLIENVNDDGQGLKLTAVDSVAEYLENGPNNELYMNGFPNNNVVLFKLSVKSGETPYIQIGVHRKAHYEFAANGETTYPGIVWGSTADDIINKRNAINVNTGTEQYYSIDFSKLTQNDDGTYNLLIGVNADGDTAEYDAVVLTNIKYKGVTIEKIVDNAPTADQLSADPLMAQAVALAAYYSDPYDPELSVVSADVLAIRGIFSKKTTATLTVRADKPITRITVTDSNGCEVDVKQYTIGFPGYAKIITATWQTTASRGDVLEYTVRAYSADGLASVNTVNVTAKVK